VPDLQLRAALRCAIVTRALSATTLDEKLTAQAGREPMIRNAGNVLFWLVILLFLPAILPAFELRGLLEPVQGMLNKLLDALPNIFAAAVIGFVGWLVAKVPRGLVTNLLVAAGADKAATAAGPHESVRLSRLAGTIVFIFVFVPTLIAALDALKIEALSRPATDMLGQSLDAVPNLVAAALILIVGFWLANVANLAIFRASGEGTSGLAQVARIAILGLVVATGLRAMGIADDIVNLGFLLTFGAVAVAVALSFGLGGRDAAGRQMEHWLSQLRK
jgi:hypothetical protein